MKRCWPCRVLTSDEWVWAPGITDAEDSQVSGASHSLQSRFPLKRYVSQILETQGKVALASVPVTSPLWLLCAHLPMVPLTSALMECGSFPPGPGSWAWGEPRAAHSPPRMLTPTWFSAWGLLSELPALTQILPGEREEAVWLCFSPGLSPKSNQEAI